jgi:3',5'-cyclic AMP phosphodiesterase CpdA
VNSTIRILHLSDTHVPAGGSALDGSDPLAALDRLLTDVRHIEALDLVLVTGDIADDGSADGCIAVRRRVARFAAARGAAQVYLPGNHDTREGFAEAFGSGHLSASGRDLSSASFDGPESAAVSHHRGVRVVTLDSVVPGEVHGELGAAQLDWLRGVLSRPAPQGTIIALHHPPIPFVESPYLSGVGLRNPRALEEAIAGTDVRGVLCGHFHLPAGGFLGSVPVWVSAGVATRIDATAPRDTVRFATESGATVVGLTHGGGPYFHVLQPHEGERNGQTFTLAPELADATNGR